MTGHRLRTRTIAALAMVLSLSGCWSGPPLFAASDSVPGAIPDGDYFIREAVGPDTPRPFDRPSEEEVLRVRAQRDGSLRVTTGKGRDGRDLQVMPVPLIAPTDRRFVLQVEDRQRDVGRDASYLLLDARRTPSRIHVLTCDADAKRAVENSGGYVSRDPQSASSCIFRNASVLRSELRRVIAREPAARDALELIPLPHARR